jgi:hypothetical protein
MTIFGPHFERVFSNHRPVDFKVLDLIPQREQLMEINHPIIFEESQEKPHGSMVSRWRHTRLFGRKMRMHIHRYVCQFFDGTRAFHG